MAKTKLQKHKAKAKSAAPAKGAQGHKDVCFIICPFGGWNDIYCEEIFEPAVESAGLEARRADDLYRPSAIVHDIWDYVKKSRVMLAELTGKNPNVLYELGLAHAAGKPVVMVTQSMEDVPFDLRSLRVLVYDVENPDWNSILREKIKNALGEIAGSPELAVPPAFLRVRKGGRQTSVSPLKRRLLELEQQVDILRAQRGDHRDERIGAAEADALIRSYVAAGMPDRYIVRNLADRGAPAGWVRDRLAELSVRRGREPVKVDQLPLGTQPVPTPPSVDNKPPDEKKAN